MSEGVTRPLHSARNTAQLRPEVLDFCIWQQLKLVNEALPGLSICLMRFQRSEQHNVVERFKLFSGWVGVAISPTHTLAASDFEWLLLAHCEDYITHSQLLCIGNCRHAPCTASEILLVHRTSVTAEAPAVKRQACKLILSMPIQWRCKFATTCDVHQRQLFAQSRLRLLQTWCAHMLTAADQAKIW